MISFSFFHFLIYSYPSLWLIYHVAPKSTDIHQVSHYERDIVYIYKIKPKERHNLEFCHFPHLLPSQGGRVTWGKMPPLSSIGHNFL